MQEHFAPLDPPRRLLMGSGPSNAEPRVLQAMAAVPISPDDPTVQVLLEGLALLEKSVFRAESATCLAVPGASRAGLEAAIASLIEPGDRVLVGVFGHFGELLCTLASRHGARVERVDAEWGMSVESTTMVARIKQRTPKLVAIVHADTSTGVVQPLEAIGAACRETGAMLLADCVLSIGGCEVEVDEWGVDVAVGGLQKCLGGPPGVALVTLSSRAQAALSVRKHPPQSAYLDLSRLTSAWCGTETATELSTSMHLAAYEALRIVLDEGLTARWRRHRAASQALRAGLDAMGLSRFVRSDDLAPMITLVSVPDGIDDAGVRQQLLLEHGIEIMAAFGPLRGRVWRIGAMGTNARLPSVLAVLSGLESVLVSRGWTTQRGAAVDAARAAAHA